jgi:lysophospholipase L1-like esterase
MKNRFDILAAGFLLILLGCNSPENESVIDEPPQEEVSIDTTTKAEAPMEYTYLALGDSYTIGESVPEEQRWPVQLAAMARNDGNNLLDPVIIATTGWTTAELQSGIEAAQLGDSTFNFVSLLIGVNNQYRGYDFAIYEKEFVELLNQSIAFAAGDTANVFVVSIPDWGVTPFANGRDQEKIAREIDEYNAYAEQVCNSLNVKYINITDISREATENASLIADDNLHPSGFMYERWVEERIYPWFKTKFNQ